jgi:hypothetical protein
MNCVYCENCKNYFKKIYFYSPTKNLCKKNPIQYFSPKGISLEPVNIFSKNMFNDCKEYQPKLSYTIINWLKNYARKH